MLTIKRYLRMVLLLFVVFFGQRSIHPAEAASAPVIQAPYAVAINADTGEILYGKEPHHRAYPASITKLMTVLLMEEHMKAGETITATPDAVAQYPSNWFYRMHLGEKMSKKDALNALMIISSNDVAVAVADHIAGSEKGFAKLMNAKVKALGLKGTHFVTPNGLQDPNHYTTPYDMAIIAKADLPYPDIFKAMQATTYMIHTDQQTAEIYRRDKIDDNPLAFGGKTGYTDQAGQTIVEYEKKGNKKIIVVLMKTNLQTEYQDIKTLTNDAFNRMNTEQIAVSGHVYKNVQVNGTALPVAFASNVSVEDATGDVIAKKVHWLPQEVFKKGVKKGSTVGTMTVTLNNKVISKVNLIATQDVAPVRIPLPKKVREIPNKTLVVSVTAFGLLLVGYFIFKPRSNKRKRLFDQ